MNTCKRTMMLLSVVLSALAFTSNAFVTPGTPSFAIAPSSKAKSTSMNMIFGKKEPEEDLSYIESRDLTREEMMDLNKQNEEIMNMELSMMTGFSLILSLPILYLCWVAFFSE